MMELASSRFAASWMPSNIYSGKRDDFFAVDVMRHGRPRSTNELIREFDFELFA